MFSIRFLVTKSVPSKTSARAVIKTQLSLET